MFVRAFTTTGDPFPEFNGTVDFTVDDGRYRIAKVYQTEGWNPELRAPLARLQTLVGLLEQAGGPPELLNQVHAECDQLRGLIGEITTLARVDSAAHGW